MRAISPITLRFWIQTKTARTTNLPNASAGIKIVGNGGDAGQIRSRLLAAKSDQLQQQLTNLLTGNNKAHLLGGLIAYPQ